MVFGALYYQGFAKKDGGKHGAKTEAPPKDTERGEAAAQEEPLLGGKQEEK